MSESSHGTTWSVEVSSSLTAVKDADISEINTGEREEIDETHHDSTDEEFRLADIAKGRGFSAEIDWDEDDSAHGAIEAAHAAGTPLNQSVAIANGQTLTFTGYVVTLPWALPVNGKKMRTATVRITGAITLS
ncbi:MAG: hypothetical protein HRU10_09350 [Opitutales bacterium]|nr:hypothetical protein [Opitutales bacterium]